MLEKKKKKSGLNSERRKDFWFMIAIIALPMIQYCMETLWIRLDTYILAFCHYTGGIDDGFRTWAGLYNIKEVLSDVFNEPLFKTMLKNGLIRYLVPLPISLFEIVITYYMFRKFPFTSGFRTILYIPMMTAGMASTMMAKFFMNFTLPDMFGLEKGLLQDNNTAFWALIIYGKWVNLGGSILGQLAVMNSTDLNTLEAGQLDGVGFFGELWHIVLPKSYRFISLGFILGVALIFTGDGGLIPYYGENAPSELWGIGYYTAMGVRAAAPHEYPYYAAFGVCLTIVLTPTLIGLRKAVFKFGPSED